MKKQILSEEFERMKELANIYESIDTPQWPDAIHNFIVTNLSNDEQELYLVIKALKQTIDMFKKEMKGPFDPNFHHTR